MSGRSSFRTRRLRVGNMTEDVAGGLRWIATHGCIIVFVHVKRPWTGRPAGPNVLPLSFATFNQCTRRWRRLKEARGPVVKIWPRDKRFFRRRRTGFLLSTVGSVIATLEHQQQQQPGGRRNPSLPRHLRKQTWGF